VKILVLKILNFVLIKIKMFFLTMHQTKIFDVIGIPLQDITRMRDYIRLCGREYLC